MGMLQDKLAAQIPGLRDEIKALVKESGDKVISEVTIAQAYGGARGVKCLICDTSEVAQDKGVIIRGIPVKELTKKLPEEVLWLLMTGELPNEEEAADLGKDLAARAEVPGYVWDVLKAMPEDAHPMCMLNTAILSMEGESKFRKAYNEGVKKPDYWLSTLEDALDIIAKTATVAAGVYRMRYKKGDLIAPDKGKDFGANYAAMLGVDDPSGNFAKLMQLYLVLHSDHESGNVSANATQTVNSALSDLYYSLSAGLNGLAGPLHGLANQECLAWVIEVHKQFKGVPSDEDLKKFAWDTLNSGKVIPGYGHAVLRVTDPRFDAFLAFGREYCMDDEVFQIVSKVFDIVPGVLKEHGKAKNPWPNVDAGSGSLLNYYGLKEFEYYTVLFSVSRAMGVCSMAVGARAMGYPIIRPKSITTAWLKAEAAK